MRVEELGTRVWPVELRGSTLVVGGLELNLVGLADQGVTHVLVYADGEGRPTLEATPWLGAEVGLPPYFPCGTLELMVYFCHRNHLFVCFRH